jgi:5-methylcytosine-specific restriction enzyme subunit McrC
MPAFDKVSEELNLNEIKHSKTNAFYKEYAEGIRLAKLILKRFGYNITNTQQATIQTPPFWIDMSKLFELYVFGLMRDRFNKKDELIYHFNTNYQELDYLINSPEYKIVVDAKYKERYRSNYDKEDIRQVSGYARMKSVYKSLEKHEDEIIDCLIIYPDQSTGNKDLKNIDLTKTPISQFVHLYKLPILLPVLK